MKQGLQCLIGDDTEIDVFTDALLNTHPPRSPRIIDGGETDIVKVRDLFYSGTKI